MIDDHIKLNKIERLPWFLIEYFSLRCSRVPIEDFFGLFIPTKWKKNNKEKEKKK